MSLTSGGGHDGSTGLSVSVGKDQAGIYQTDIAKAEEGYLTFWFNPNNVNLPDPPTSWPPKNALNFAEIFSSAGGHWQTVVSLYLRKPSGEGYKGFLVWPKAMGMFYDYQTGQFDLANGWQKITLGYRINSWVAVWVNDSLVHYYTDVSHDAPYGDAITLGKVNSNSETTPNGSIRFDDVAFQVPRLGDLWVDAVHGNDANAGMSSSTAFRTIQKAADIAGPGTTVHILPGVYRETVWPALSGSDGQPVVYRAENGPGTAIIRGSEPSASLTWTQLAANTIGLPAGVDPTKIYYTDLSAWNLNGPPRFLVQLDGTGSLSPEIGEGGQRVGTRLPLAREPDWQVTTDWKYAEFWWAADGGSSPAACNPATNTDHNCDLPQRSTTQLTGATLVAMDTVEGHYVYRRTITVHDVAQGLITVGDPCEFDSSSGNPGLG